MSTRLLVLLAEQELAEISGAGPFNTNKPLEKDRWDELDDIVSTTGLAMLGLTTGCARCHSHKYDPISIRDYYRMAGAFPSSKRKDRPVADGKAHALSDTGIASATGWLLARGNHEQKTEKLPARVAVNRLWKHHFGRGLVGTPFDFGVQGDLKTMHRLGCCCRTNSCTWTDDSRAKTMADPYDRSHDVPRSPTRRDFLPHGGAGFGLLGLAGVLQQAGLLAAERSTAPHFTPRAKSVIWLFMHGGPSAVDLFDPKPELDRRDGEAMNMGNDVGFFTSSGQIMKSPFAFRQHGESGAWVSEAYPAVARHVDKFAFIKSMHAESSHAGNAIGATSSRLN